LAAKADRRDEPPARSVLISDTPEKAVSIPLMRRDIDDMKGS
jgi:hypothetical protein